MARDCHREFSRQLTRFRLQVEHSRVLLDGLRQRAAVSKAADGVLASGSAKISAETAKAIHAADQIIWPGR